MTTHGSKVGTQNRVITREYKYSKVDMRNLLKNSKIIPRRRTTYAYMTDKGQIKLGNGV